MRVRGPGTALKSETAEPDVARCTDDPGPASPSQCVDVRPHLQGVCAPPNADQWGGSSRQGDCLSTATCPHKGPGIR